MSTEQSDQRDRSENVIPEHENFIFVALDKSSTKEWIWYKVRVSHEGNYIGETPDRSTFKVLEPFFKHKRIGGMGTASMGSAIYLIGGNDENYPSHITGFEFRPIHDKGADLNARLAFIEQRRKALDNFLIELRKTDCRIRTVKLFDAMCGNPSLGDIALMNRQRQASVQVPFKGKLYVFGGVSRNACEADLERWGEVYDPKFNRWDPLAKPDPQILDIAFRFSAAPLERMNCILLIGGNLKGFFYYPDNGGRWEEILIAKSKSVKYEPELSNCVVHDDIVYWYCQRMGVLFAFDPKANKLLSTFIEGLWSKEERADDCNSNEVCVCTSFQLLHFGNGLFSFLQVVDNCLQFTKFHVKKDDEILEATFVSFQSLQVTELRRLWTAFVITELRSH